MYVSDSQPGISRLRRGKGFSYRDASGHRLNEPDELARIRALAIPPAYSKVWICSNPCGHLQATGRDARGRKQYRYHPAWRKMRDKGKFDRLLAFGHSLPALRRRVRRDLALPGLPCDKVLALLVGLLDETLIRIGNDEYARSNHSYGLTTLLTRHVRKERGRLRFLFKGKSGQMQDVELDNARLIRTVRRMQHLPGQRLFQYLNDENMPCPVDSGMVNDYLRDTCDDDTSGTFSAKDFRTWGATVFAAAALMGTPLPRQDASRRSTLLAVVKEVAVLLGNTPAVCRASYIHPRVLEGWLDGSLQRCIPATATRHPRQMERHTLRFLKRAARSARTVKGH